MTFLELKQRWSRARERRWVRWATDLAVLMVAVLAIGAWQARHHLRDVPAPAFSLAQLSDAKNLSSTDLRGRPAMVVFWAPWCGVCKVESQNVSWVRKLVGERARVISIATAYDERSQVERYVREHDVDYPVLLGDDAVLAEWKVDVFPTVYFLDAEGKVKRSVSGYSTTAGLLWRLLL